MALLLPSRPGLTVCACSSSTIHLLGNYIDQFPFNGGRDDYDDLDSDSEYDSDGYPLGDSDDEEDSELDMEDSDIDMVDLEKVVGRKNGKADAR